MGGTSTQAGPAPPPPLASPGLQRLAGWGLLGPLQAEQPDPPTRASPRALPHLRAGRLFLPPHLSPQNATWAFQGPVSSTSPRRSLAPSRSPPRGGEWVHQRHRMPQTSLGAPGSSEHAGWGLRCSAWAGPGAPVVVGLGLSVAGERLVWMASEAGEAAPSPVGCSWSFLRPGVDGVGQGWWGTGARPGQDQTRRYTQPAVWLPRVTSSSFSQSPSQSGQRGPCPYSPALCQPISQPSRRVSHRDAESL